MTGLRETLEAFWGRLTDPQGMPFKLYQDGYAADFTERGAESPGLPYITYSAASPDFTGTQTVTCTVWAMERGYALVDSVLEQAWALVPPEGATLPLGEDGTVWLYRANPFTRYLPVDGQLLKAGVISAVIKLYQAPPDDFTSEGLTSGGLKSIQLGAGAFFIGPDMSGVTGDTTAAQFTDILKRAAANGKSLGVTEGGSFIAKPKTRYILADGVRMPVVGGTVFDGWEIRLATTLRELTQANFARALAASDTEPETGAVVLNNTPLPGHYIPVLGWAGRMSDGRLLYIEIRNALNVAGAGFVFADKGEGRITVDFRAHQSGAGAMRYAPCRIFYFEG